MTDQYRVDKGTCSPNPRAATETLAFVEGYSPTHIADSAWPPIAKAVRGAALISAPTLAAVKKVLPPLAAFGQWLHDEGFHVQLETLSDTSLVERYTQVGMQGHPDSTRATRRAILRRVADRLDPSPFPLPEAISYRRAKAPYNPWQIAGFHQLAAAQPTATTQRSLNAILALGLGCGLDRTDLAWVRGIDVAAGRQTVVQVIGGSRPRAVAALNDYADRIVEASAAARESLLIGGPTLGRRNVTTPTLDRLVLDASLPRLTPSRLRSTWLVSHLNLRTPLQVLLPAAGLASSRTLDDLLEYANPVASDDAARLLAGPLE